MNPLQRPIFIVGTPQSGTGYVFRALGELPEVRLLAKSGRDVLENDEELRAQARGHDSARLTAADATPKLIERLRAGLAAVVTSAGAGRLVDGAPRHALRISFLDAVFPDATFVYVYRSPRETIASMAAAWRSGEFVTHPELPGWHGPPWSMLLTPGWRALAGRTETEIATAQWTAATRIMLDDLNALAPERWVVTDFAALAADPADELERLAGVLGLNWSDPPDLSRPESYVVRATPETEATLGELPAGTVGVAQAAHHLLAAPVSRRPTRMPVHESEARSVHSPEFASVLDELGISLVLATGDLDRLVCVSSDGARVTTDFTESPQPRALAAADGELAVAGSGAVDRYRDAAANGHFAGYASIPTAADALAFAGDALWAAQAQRVDPLGDAAFEPIAVAGTVTGIAGGQDRPAFLTAERDACDGFVVDCRTGAEVAVRLIAPRAPRVYDETLLVLLDAGSLAAIDPGSGEVTVLTELPGLAEGLVIVGSIAFVALSRSHGGDFSGVVAVDLTRGAAGPFLRFEGGVREVCDLAGLRRRQAKVGVAFARS